MNAAQDQAAPQWAPSSNEPGAARESAAIGPRVLMFGWEYPPRLAGGLGKACAGLSQAMARAGCKVYFVLPSFPRAIVGTQLQVVGARQMLARAGWTPEHARRYPYFERHRITLNGSEMVEAPSHELGNLVRIRAKAELHPYGLHPLEPLPPGLATAAGLQGAGEQPGFEVTATGSTQAAPWPAAIENSTPSPDDHIVIDPSPEALPPDEASAGGEVYGRNLWSEIERYCFAASKLAAVYDADVVHAHDWMSFPAALEYQRARPHVPVFVHVHATEYDRSGENVHSDVFRIEREGFRKATHIFTVSHYTAGIIERLYGIPRNKITVVYNAPDEDTKQLLRAPETKRAPQAVFLGRLTFQKGPEHFLRAARMVVDLLPPQYGKPRFLLVGTGDLMERLVALVSELKLEDHVIFTGFMDPAQVDEVLLESKVLVMPSVSEPFGLVALEAIHCGIPVILSKQSGVREVLQDSLQIDFWDHERLAEHILAAFRLEALSRQLAQEGMNQIRTLTWDKSARVVMETYRRYV